MNLEMRLSECSHYKILHVKSKLIERLVCMKPQILQILGFVDMLGRRGIFSYSNFLSFSNVLTKMRWHPTNLREGLFIYLSVCCFMNIYVHFKHFVRSMQYLYERWHYEWSSNGDCTSIIVKCNWVQRMNKFKKNTHLMNGWALLLQHIKYIPKKKYCKSIAIWYYVTAVTKLILSILHFLITCKYWYFHVITTVLFYWQSTIEFARKTVDVNIALYSWIW